MFEFFTWNAMFMLYCNHVFVLFRFHCNNHFQNVTTFVTMYI